MLQRAGSEEDEPERRKRVEWEGTMRSVVKSLKDVVEVKFETKNAGEGKDKSWICPVTRKVLDENARAVYLVPCGHAFEEVAVKETMVEGDVSMEGKPRCLQVRNLMRHPDK